MAMIEWCYTCKKCIMGWKRGRGLAATGLGKRRPVETKSGLHHNRLIVENGKFKFPFSPLGVWPEEGRLLSLEEEGVSWLGSGGYNLPFEGVSEGKGRKWFVALMAPVRHHDSNPSFTLKSLKNHSFLSSLITLPLCATISVIRFDSCRAMESTRELHSKVIQRARVLVQSDDETLVEKAIAKILCEKPFSMVVNRISDIYSELEKVQMELGRQKVEAGVVAPVVTQFECPICDNKDQQHFVPKKDGSIVCRGVDGRGCGEVVAQDQVYEGSMFRNFSDNQDRNSFGPIQDPVFSTSYNLGTMNQRGAAKASKGKGSSGGGKETDFSVSNIGRDAGATRIEYKDEQKIKAFSEMVTATRSLGLHQSAYNKARIMFATYRDAKDRLQDFPSALAACLIAGHLEVLEEERVGEGGGAPRAFNCPKCKAVFNCKVDRDRHMKMEHDELSSSSSMGDGGSSNNILEDELQIQSWGIEEITRWLGSKSTILQQAAPAILAGLGETWKVALKDNPAATAGGELMLAGQVRVSRWCQEYPGAGAELCKALQEIKDHRLRKQRLEKQEEHQRIRKKQRMEYERVMLGRTPSD